MSKRERPERPGALRPVRPSPWWAGWRLSVALLAFVVAAGTAGYSIVEGWTLWDAFYMTVISVTTAGYREVHPLSRAGEALTVVVLTVGV